jgi:acetyltransferase-like isoleucine patch superfamily enzyme
VGLGRTNHVACSGADLWDTRIVFAGDGNVVTVEADCVLQACTIEVFGSGHRVHFGRSCRLQGLHVRLEDRDCAVTVGAFTTVEGAHLAAVEPGMRIVIGEGCMLSHDIDVRTSDSHTIYDLNSGARVNPPASVSIGPRTWVGAHVNVLKGVTIGADCVIGLGALVTRDVPTGCVAGGTPARVIRQGIRWSRER